MKGEFAVVVPTYNVERYLDEFLESLALQAYPIADIELIFVDDGSTDLSDVKIADWIAHSAPGARLIRKENGGSSSARNTGLEEVTSTWVTFCDPDDRLSPNYFIAVADFIAQQAADELHLVATRMMMLDDATGVLSDAHPLRFRFEKGRHVVDLDRHPDYFQLSAASAFYRTELLNSLGLRFDQRVQPNFEDAHLTGLYLAGQARPRMGFIRDAVYHYRRRADGSSQVQESWKNPSKFTDVPRHGYLDLLDRVAATRGEVPLWLQNMVLYDILWYFKQDELIHSPIGDILPQTAAEFHEILGAIMRHIDVSTIEAYRITATSPDIRSALILGAKGERSRPERIRIEQIDPRRRIALLRYYYSGDLPVEDLRGRGLRIEPIFSKSRSVVFLGRQMVSERIVWLPANGTIQVALDGRRRPIDLGNVSRDRYVVGPTRMWDELNDSSPPTYDDAPRGRPTDAATNRSPYRRLRRKVGRVRNKYRYARSRIHEHRLLWKTRWNGLQNHFSQDQRLIRQASGRRGREYRRAWVFTDRLTQAQDNAEHLCRHVRTYHPEINAWFVMNRGATDWERLTREGFRMVELGTDEHLLLMLNCEHLISSHADHVIVHPIDRKRFPARWQFTFLQHGVIHNDLSRWLNSKPISRFITTTALEHQAIAGDDTLYKYTDKEVSLTGLPRHDRLLALARNPATNEGDRLLLVMPTWRRELLGDDTVDGQLRRWLPGFWESTYARNWLDVVTSPRLKKLADRMGARIAFVPHPNMTIFHSCQSLPDHVDLIKYDGIDIQKVFARGAMTITDYSSNAFEMAYLERPIVYFQFDQQNFFSGAHIARKGYWSYEDDGFGRSRHRCRTYSMKSNVSWKTEWNRTSPTRHECVPASPLGTENVANVSSRRSRTLLGRSRTARRIMSSQTRRDDGTGCSGRMDSGSAVTGEPAEQSWTDTRLVAR